MIGKNDVMNAKTRATLLEHLRNGADQLSWEEFFRTYWPLLYVLAKQRGCSDHTAEEVVQDVILTVFERRDFYEYDPKRGRFRDWLATLVRNKVAEYRRRPSERVRAQGGDSGTEMLDRASDDLPPDAQCEAAFEDGLLLVLLEVVRRETKPQTYLAFELSALHQLRGAEVAEATGMTPNAVYKARKRVLRRLIELGGEYRDDGRLVECLKRALQLWPKAGGERGLTTRVENTIRSR